MLQNYTRVRIEETEELLSTKVYCLSKLDNKKMKLPVQCWVTLDGKLSGSFSLLVPGAEGCPCTN